MRSGNAMRTAHHRKGTFQSIHPISHHNINQSDRQPTCTPCGPGPGGEADGEHGEMMTGTLAMFESWLSSMRETAVSIHVEYLHSTHPPPATRQPAVATRSPGHPPRSLPPAPPPPAPLDPHAETPLSLRVAQSPTIPPHTPPVCSRGPAVPMMRSSCAPLAGRHRPPCCCVRAPRLMRRRRSHSRSRRRRPPWTA